MAAKLPAQEQARMQTQEAAPKQTAFTLATPEPLTVEEALRSFRLPDDLTIELVAAEPDVVDPVAIRFDAQGRLWVVQMVDYPYGPQPGERPLSRISRLEDRDHDGRYETAVVFAEELLFPTGLQPWRDGVLVTLAGKIVWMRDQDDDGRCDSQEVWFEGFTQENSQLRANHPTLALDNTIYVANGLRGGEVHDVRRADAPRVSIRNRDFHFDPRSGTYHAVSGLSQFGMTFDDFGHRFLCSNRNPCRHVVLEDRYLARNPGLPISEVVHDVAAYAEHSRVHPLTRAWTTSNLHAHQFTAACGVLYYRGTALGEAYRDSIFVCEPTGNLVHQEVVVPQGASFQSRPAFEDREFLASTDEWFRPVNLELGPDGALYVVDMYRAVIEHPEFMPDELKQRPDLLLGRDRGRIWRVRGRTSSRHFEPVGTTAERWLAALQHPNAWQRETAARLILENQPQDLIKPLERLAQEAPLPATRAQALWLLRAYDALSEDHLLRALTDLEPGVREQALILSESFREDGKWRERVAACSRDPDPRVRFQAALWLTPAQSPGEVETLLSIFWQGVSDVWTRRAVQLAAGEYAALLLQRVIEQPPPETVSAGTWVEIVAELAQAAARTTAPSQALFEVALRAASDSHAVRARAGRAALAQLLAVWSPKSPSWRDWLTSADYRQAWQALMENTSTLLRQTNHDLQERREALELARFDATQEAVRQLCLEPQDDARLRATAIGYIDQAAPADFWRALIARYRQELPPVRSAIVDAALKHRQVAEWLIEAVEQGMLRPLDISAADFARLERHPDSNLRSRVARLASQRTPAERQAVLTQYQPCLQLPADPMRGRAVFAKTCASCHRIAGIGVDVAPDISDSRTKTAQQLLVDILQPNRAIDAHYTAYVITTTDGRVLTGIIAAETATSITLRQAEGKTEMLSRTDIESIQSTGLSLMPEGLERDLSLQDMADVIAFIKNWRYLEQTEGRSAPLP